MVNPFDPEKVDEGERIADQTNLNISKDLPTWSLPRLEEFRDQLLVVLGWLKTNPLNNPQNALDIEKKEDLLKLVQKEIAMRN